jgi:hypothetical protein
MTMVHRFLEHNLVVIALKAAYLDGKTKGKTLEEDKSEEASVCFSNAAVSVLPKEIRDWENTVEDDYPSALINEPPIVFSPPKRSTFVGLIRGVWLRGYRSSSNLTIEGPFETWLKTLDKTDKELNLEAYEVGFEVIRKETSLLSRSEYKPSWALMVATYCSIGTYNVDMLNVGDIVEYGRHSACKVLSIDKKNRVANVCRIEDNYSVSKKNRKAETVIVNNRPVPKN